MVSSSLLVHQSSVSSFLFLKRPARVSIRDPIQRCWQPTTTMRESLPVLTFWCFPYFSIVTFSFLIYFFWFPFWVFVFWFLGADGRNFVDRKSQSRNDECLVAQERLHPDCARRPERYHLPPPPLPPASSGGGGGATAMGGSMASSSPALGTNEASPPHHTPACHHLAEECKAHPDCK
jgi:hypothetical protein